MAEIRKVIYCPGDGIGPEIMDATISLLDKALNAAYGGSKKLCWEEVDLHHLADDPSILDKIRDAGTALKGPMMTPVGKGARSINVALRQSLDLYACVRPVKYFSGVPSPVVHPDLIDMVVFRENTEDIYSGIEWNAGTPEVQKVISFLQNEMGVKKIRFPETSSIGVKNVSKEGSERLIRSAIRYAEKHGRKSVTIVHKGNIMKFTEGGFRAWGYELASHEFGAAADSDGVIRTSSGILINDCICDNFLQKALLRPQDYDVIATLNLNGDYISDALAAQVGGIGYAPGANINYETGIAVYEATHGIAPDIAGKNLANPMSLIFSACMMLENFGWTEASSLIYQGVEKLLSDGRVTSDFYYLRTSLGQKSELLGTKEFAAAILA